MHDDRPIHADQAAERLLTPATVITFIRTLLVIGLAVYWVGDTLDGEVARWRDCETRIGAVVDMLSDRLNCAGFYLGLAWLHPIMAIPVSVYLFEFMVVVAFLSLAFLAWPIRSPNYFYAVDRRLWLWNWSCP